MKQEVSIIMLKANIKFLTFILALTLPLCSKAASLVSLENAKTHLRLNILADKNFISIDKKADEIYIKTLNSNVFDTLVEEVQSLNFDSRYVSEVRVQEKSENNVSTLLIKLTDKDVELFSFYRERHKRYVLDFWIEDDRPFSSEKIKVGSKIKPPKQITAPLVQVDQDKTDEGAANKTQSDEVSVKASKVTPVSNLKSDKENTKNTQREFLDKGPYRDFRYGASFIWNYEPLAPKAPKVVNLERKTAEAFYPIENRDIEKSEEEAHLQLSINMYRDKKWGLMYKSIKLFEKKYPNSKLSYLNEYLKANAILRENFERGESEPVRMAVTMYGQLSEKVDDYELKKGLFKYLIEYAHHSKDYAKTLKLAKKYYVETQENFDYESSEYAVQMILTSLGQLGQVEQMRSLAKDKTLTKMIPAQLLKAYEIYALMKLNKSEEVIKEFEKIKPGLVKPIHSSIIFNAAESYFRNSQYEKAIELFDEFIADHSKESYSSHARLRLALSYDILGKDFKQALRLYKDAINRSQNLDVSYEARIRYAAMKSVRPRELTEQDREVRVFLNRDKDRHQNISKNLRHILWLTRLRTFIVDEDYQKALSYLNTIPLSSLTQSKRRVFEGDGSEIIYGMISDMYKQSDYSNVVKLWEVYKDKYVNKVADDSYLNYIVGQSYIKLGLYDGFDKLYERFSQLKDEKKRSFPIWASRQSYQESNELLLELQIVRHIQLENWQTTEKLITKLRNLSPGLNKTNYYQGIISHKLKDYEKAASLLETYLAGQTQRAIYDPTEVAQMMLAYTDSLYQLNRVDHFQKVAMALIDDTRGFAPENEYVKEVREQVAYLLIESYAGKGSSEDYATIQPLIVDFKEVFPDSQYKDRIEYLLGLSHVETKNKEKGVEVFEGLLQDEAVSDSIKDLVKSELSLLKIKERTI